MSTCDTCARDIRIDEANGIQCVWCYAPAAPRMTRKEWEQAGRPEPVRIVRPDAQQRRVNRERANA